MLFSKLSIVASLLAGAVAAPLENLAAKRHEAYNLLAYRMTETGKRESIDEVTYGIIEYSIGKRDIETLAARSSAGDENIYNVAKVKRGSEESEQDTYSIIVYSIGKREAEEIAVREAEKEQDTYSIIVYSIGK
ncbi:hypothetical protein UCREL1_6577 [Eutypa lata UCREL1]|uniref:Uncharacterized protein n=1 Tax=Eutypa lata (strain UCR-EL1) TaxID=1287681 RepID=M7SPP6_EUTLA|nr:hypothetical protein UCREL1_6577 [Eutypa lata UCREL1]